MAALSAVFAAAAVFTQCQLKYGAERDNFLHRWYERPLHQNTAYADADDGGFLNPAAWKKTVESFRQAKIDGAAFFASRLDRRSDVFVKSLMPGGETQLLLEMSNAKGPDGYFAVAERALNTPNCFRIGGKCVLTVRKDAERCDAGFVRELKAGLTAKYGDRFILLPHNGVFGKRDFVGGKASPEALARARDHVREILRASDGLMYQWGLEGLVGRRYDRSLFEPAGCKVLREVFDEPEFKGKKHLGVLFNGGHMNCYRWQYNYDANGTATLCDRFETVLKLAPDLVILAEWDEENENTHFRPTVSRGNSYLRMVRHFADRLAGRPPTAMPGDDTSVPNLLVSYRKELVAGEPVEAEVRNIPDGTFGGETFTVRFSWLDGDGKPVKTYPPRSLDADVQSAVRFVTPSGELAANRFLVPSLRIEWKNGFREYSDGLYPLGISALRNPDHVWAVHPLRDLPPDVNGEISIGERDADGVRTVRGRVVSSTPLRSVEVTDNMDSVYMHSSGPEVPEGFERIRIETRGFIGVRRNMLDGTIRFRDAPGARLEPFRDGRRVAEVSGCGWDVRNVCCDNWGAILWADVPSGEMKAGSIDVDLPPHFRGTVKLADLLKRDVVGFNSSDSCGLTVTRYLPTVRIPRPLMTNRVEFAFRWKPLEKSSVLRMHAIDERYRVWRSRPETVYRPSGRTVPLTVIGRDRGDVSRISFDANRIEDLECDLSGRQDSVLRLGSGRMYVGMVGASAALAQGFGIGDSHYGNPLAESKKYYKGGTGDLMPKSGWGCLPLQTVPGFAAFELCMRIKPNGFGRRQGLFGSGNCGLDVYLEKDGTLSAYFARGRSFTAEYGPLHAVAKGPRTEDGGWNDIRIATDRVNAWIEVNGVRGEPVPYSDCFFNQRYALFGVTLGKPNFFAGEISSISVKCR